MSPAKKASNRSMSDDHKAAIASGREASQAVRKYLEALELHKPKRGRRRTAESIQARLTVVEAEIPQAPPMKRLGLLQERTDLASELETIGEVVDLTELEAGFVWYAAAYSASKGISYSTWRAYGIPAELLRRAEIPRS